MSRRRVRGLVSDAAKGAIAFVAHAIKFASAGKIAPVGAFVGLIALLAVPLLYQAYVPSLTADSTLKCYDSAGNVAPCTTLASASPSRSNVREAEFDRTAAWTAAAFYQRARSPKPVFDQDQQASSPRAAFDQQDQDQQDQDQQDQASLPATAGSQPPSRATSALPIRRSNLLHRRAASASCGRHLIPCFFSTLRKGVTHLAAAAARHARPERNRQKIL
jgi:hypothetical protein